MSDPTNRLLRTSTSSTPTRKTHPMNLDGWEDGYFVCWPTDGTDPYPIAPSFVRQNMELDD